MGWNLTSCARSHRRWMFFAFFLYKIGEKNLFEESSYKSTNKNSSVLALILFNDKKRCFFLYSITIKWATKSCSEEGINHYTIKGNETLIYGPLDAFSLQDCRCFGLPQVIVRDLWLAWNKAPKGADSVWKKKCFWAALEEQNIEGRVVQRLEWVLGIQPSGFCHRPLG